MPKLTYTPAEFAALFGKERTWAYRQLYEGKIEAVTEFGRIMIPAAEVEKVVGKAGRYLGAKAKPEKGSKASAPATKSASTTGGFVDALRQRKTRGLLPPESAPSADVHKRASPKPPRPDGQAKLRSLAYQRLTRCKSSRKSGGGRDG